MGIAGFPYWATDIGGFHGGDPDDPQFCKCGLVLMGRLLPRHALARRASPGSLSTARWEVRHTVAVRLTTSGPKGRRCIHLQEVYVDPRGDKAYIHGSSCGTPRINTPR
jgi:hypothetical protein